MNDLAAALTDSIAADGQTPMTGALNLNTHKVINVVAGTVAGDAVEYVQFTSAFVNPTFGGTGFMLIPKGTTAQRPVSPADGYMRYNTTTNQFEGYQGGAWGQLGGGATGGGGDEVFVLNSRVVTVDYSFPADKSAESVGPITINSGATVTVSSGERWVIL
jgi:hypothetical protein